MSTQGGYKDCEGSTRNSRRRAATACFSCRSRKVRCDVFRKGIPCTNCHLDCKSCVVNTVKARRALRSVNATGSHPLWDGLAERQSSADSIAFTSTHESSAEDTRGWSRHEDCDNDLRRFRDLNFRNTIFDVGEFDESSMHKLLSWAAPEPLDDTGRVPSLSPPDTCMSTATQSSQENYESSPSSSRSFQSPATDIIDHGWTSDREFNKPLRTSKFDRTPSHETYSSIRSRKQGLMKEDAFDTVIIDVQEELYDVLMAECPWFGA